MKKIMRLMLVSGIVSICLMKAGLNTIGILMFTVSYYLFTLWVVLGVRKCLGFLKE